MDQPPNLNGVSLTCMRPKRGAFAFSSAGSNSLPQGRNWAEEEGACVRTGEPDHAASRARVCVCVRVCRCWDAGNPQSPEPPDHCGALHSGAPVGVFVGEFFFPPALMFGAGLVYPKAYTVALLPPMTQNGNCAEKTKKLAKKKTKCQL